MATKYLNGDGVKYLWSKIKALFASLATVASTGSYNDLSDKPTIPTVPTSLKNPYALTIGSVTYDGSAAKTAPEMTGASSSAAGTAGLVPAPASGAQAKFLRGDGTWQTPTNTDTKVNVTLGTTTKAYLLGTSTTPTSTAAAVTAIADTGVYLDTTAGKLTAGSFSGNGASLTSLNASNLASGTVPAARMPTATASALGGIKVGKNLSISSGVLNAPEFATEMMDIQYDNMLVSPAYMKTWVSTYFASVYKPVGSCTFANLPALNAELLGNVYNITTAFTTTASFAEGAGKSYPAGTNVAIVYKQEIDGVADGVCYDVLSGIVDLTGYVQTSNLSALTNSEIDTLLASVS